MKKLDQALTALKRAQEQVDQIVKQMKRFPEEPSIGTILTFSKTFPGGWNSAGYDYAAIRANNGDWYLTSGFRGGGARTWEELVEFIGESPCFTVAALKAL